MSTRWFMLCVMLLGWCAASAQPVDFALSGYATLGYARTDADLKYLRYIGESGTFKADSLAGVQVEASVTPRWGATIQVVASAPRSRDAGYEVQARWAFVSYRPTNDWLLRAGRLRVPIFINNENAEVGVTYDQARLPPEVYTLSPVYDIDGGGVARSWRVANADLIAEAYLGDTDIKYRFPFQRHGAQIYFPERATVAGFAVGFTATGIALRAAALHALFKPTGPDVFYETFGGVTIPAPQPLGGVVYVPQNPRDRFKGTVVTVGADWRIDHWRITAEYAQRIISDIKFGPDSVGGYISLARDIGRWTPYITQARLVSGASPRRLYETINDAPVPLLAQVPPLSLPAYYHQQAADTIAVYDQYSTMIGASYSLSPTSKLKFEFMRTHVGLASALVDGDVHHRFFNVLSASYSVTF